MGDWEANADQRATWQLVIRRRQQTRPACGAQVLFYCHFPDLLLVQRRSRLRSLYRAPLNRIEEVSTGCADRLLVNSNFTNGASCAQSARLHAWAGLVSPTACRSTRFASAPPQYLKCAFPLNIECC